MGEINEPLTYTREEIERSIKTLFNLEPLVFPDGKKVPQDIEQMFKGFWMMTDNMKAADKERGG